MGKLIPQFNGEQWDVSEEVFERAETRSYPDEYVEQPEKLLFLLCTKGNA